MIERDNLCCGHCNRPLDLCDCGSDYEIAYQPLGDVFSACDHVDGPGFRRTVLFGLVAALGLTLWVLF